MAQTQVYRGIAQVFCVEEATGGTFIDPAATDAFLAEDVQFSLSEESKRAGVHLDGFLKPDEIMTRASATLSFRIPMIGGGNTAGTDAPEYGEVLKACGFTETTGTDTVTYTPVSTFDGSGGNPAQSYSFSTIIDGIRYGLAGGFGTLVLNWSAGDMCYAEVEAMGIFQAVATDALESPTYATSIPPAYAGAQLVMTVGTDSTNISGVTSFSVDMGTQLTMLPDASETYGYSGSRITGYAPSGSFACELEDDLTPDHYGLFAGNTAVSFDTGYVGSSGNRFKLQVARATLRAPEWEDREGIHAITQSFSVSSLATDTEASNAPITLTYS